MIQTSGDILVGEGCLDSAHLDPP